MNRRHLLGVWCGILFSGCLGGSAPGTASPTVQGPVTGSAAHLGAFVLWNDDDEPHTLTLTVRTDEAVVGRTRHTVQPETTTEVPNPVGRQGSYRIAVSLENGAEARTNWRISSCHSTKYLQIYVSEGDIDIRRKQQTVVPTPTCGSGR